MGISNWFKNNLEDKERALTRDLISMAIADGDFKEVEMNEILRICEAEGISKVDLMDSIRGKKIEVPFTDEEKRDYIIHLTNVMGADDNCSPLEAHLLEVLGKRVGYSDMQVISIILSAIRQNRITSSYGLDLLDDFVTIIMEGEKQ